MVVMVVDPTTSVVLTDFQFAQVVPAPEGAVPEPSERPVTSIEHAQ